MRTNNVKNIWADGGVVVHGWLGIPSSVSAEVMTPAGFNSGTVDLQHVLVGYQASVSMLQAISTLDAICVDPADLSISLDQS